MYTVRSITTNSTPTRTTGGPVSLLWSCKRKTLDSRRYYYPSGGCIFSVPSRSLALGFGLEVYRGVGRSCQWHPLSAAVMRPVNNPTVSADCGAQGGAPGRGRFRTRPFGGTSSIRSPPSTIESSWPRPSPTRPEQPSLASELSGQRHMAAGRGAHAR